MTRRLVEIELNDADVPPPPGSGQRRANVYLRVLATSPESLRVELWDRGEFFGARRLGSTDVKELLARRIALAAGALVRDLKVRRAAEAHAIEREKEEREREREALREALRWPAVTFAARASAALVGPGDLWLAGPGLSGQLRTRTGSRLGVGINWMFGGVPAASGSTDVRWLELSVTPEHAFPVARGVDLAVGASAAAAAVHFTEVARVDAVPGELDTWSGRAVGRLMVEPRLGSSARLSAGPEVGAVVRRMPIVDGSGRGHRLGGLWVGVAVALELDPGARF